MEILALSRRLSIICGVCAPSAECGFWAKFYHILTILFILVCFSMMETSNVLYALYQLELGNLVDLFFACLQVTGIISSFLSYISIAYQTQNTRKVFDKLQTIFDQFERTPTVTIYLKTNALCEKIMKWAMIVQEGSYAVPSLLLLASTAMFQYIQNGYVEIKKLYGFMPMKTKLPFDENTLLAFSYVFTCNYIFGTVLLAITVVVPAIFLSMGLFFNTFRKHFQLMFQNMNELVCGDHTPGYELQLKLCLIEAINFHNQVKDIFDVVDVVMSGSVFCQLLFAILFLSGISFELEMVMKTMDSNIFVLLACVFMSAGWLFLFCSVGSYTTENFSLFADISYESLWYKFPKDLKKYLQLIIADAQQPRIFSGLGITSLDMMTFTQVMKTVSSYYLMFKSLTGK